MRKTLVQVHVIRWHRWWKHLKGALPGGHAGTFNIRADDMERVKCIAALAAILVILQDAEIQEKQT